MKCDLTKYTTPKKKDSNWAKDHSQPKTWSLCALHPKGNSSHF
jgi:hypothetical protein